MDETLEIDLLRTLQTRDLSYLGNANYLVPRAVVKVALKANTLPVIEANTFVGEDENASDGEENQTISKGTTKKEEPKMLPSHPNQPKLKGSQSLSQSQKLLLKKRN